MSSPYLIFLEVALVALALWLHSVLFSLVTFIVLSYFTPKYMYDKTNFRLWRHFGLKITFFVHFILFLAHFGFSSPKFCLKLINMNRKNVVYNWNIKIMKNSIVKISTCGAILI